MRARVLVLLLAAAGLLAVASPARAVSLQQIGNFPKSFVSPTYVTSLPDPNQLLIVERRGTVQLWDGIAASTFLDIRGRVNETAPEQGMFSVAVAPDYLTTGHIYAFYTDENDNLQIDEFTASGTFAPASTRRNVLTILHPDSPDHNGGQLQFGRDGYLYLSTGDGDSAGPDDVDAQDASTLLGKILRIDPRPSGAAQYSVPPDNPFGNEVWALGLRNPWRFSFDALTGALLIGDVGETQWEEVDYAAGGGRGLNFGWNCREGPAPFLGCGPPSGSAFTQPIFAYSHDADQVCNAITGGYVVRDPNLTGLYGRYLYADLCAGEIRSIVVPSGTGDRSEGLPPMPFLQSFGQDSCGRVYVAAADGSVFRLVGDTPTVCEPPTPVPTRAVTCAGLAATRTAGATGAVIGTSGPDVLVGDERKNKIRGRAGNDLICAGAGADRIRGGPGRDRLRAGPGRDHCSGGPGKDAERSCLKR
jgi:Glucose / Sorbosone dehydrogenase/RTX calcium-binding nonapeptide repeat (4 copies)